jgi:hypothetical protein
VSEATSVIVSVLWPGRLERPGGGGVLKAF